MGGQTNQNKAVTEVDLYTFQLAQPQQEIVQRLREIITEHYPELSESLKWHVPVYSWNRTPWNRAGHLLGIQVFKRHVNLNFFKGAELFDPQEILAGSGKQVRHMTFRTVKDIDRDALQALIDQTIALEQG